MSVQQTMMGLVYQGNGTLSLQERPVPTILSPKDAVLRVTRSAICTSDLHIKNGAVPRAKEGVILGHEFVGVVTEIGSDVHHLAVGDRVAANCITFCGDCWFCRQGYINNCEQGGWELGCRIDGCQAEFVRVPFADMGLCKIPDSVSDEDALFLGDIVSSGYFGAELAEITPGDTVAVIGAGPVGMCAMQSAKIFGAGKITALDIDQKRLDYAKEKNLCDVTIHCDGRNLQEEIRKIADHNGADAVIECAGSSESFQTAWQIARPNAVVAIVAMYEEAQSLPLHQMYGKNLIFKTGGVDAVHCQRLMKLIEAGRFPTDFLISHRAPLNDILEGYRIFENKLDGCIKWVVTPYER